MALEDVDKKSKNRTSKWKNLLKSRKYEKQKCRIDEKFSKAFSYSIHTLADMQFKFANATGIKLSHSECNYLRQKLSLASSDKYKTSMLKKLKNYCKVNNYNDIADYILNG